ncbi:MAG: DUF3488 and DUF4129 domain-containing transglutaminase family protein [Cyanophyceae cyanobacterium]
MLSESFQLWQRREATPFTVENSIRLRILVQGLAVVGIVAIDWAAQTHTSWWAIPISTIGGVWSWYRRRQRNIAVKFLLAIGMLAVLLIFFDNLLGNLNDSRMVLAQLLIQLQVLHSFDLPRRKDLGYSMVIGLILLGVAGTVSQTSSFAVLPLLFLGIALPTLVFDYRSRLGVREKIHWQSSLPRLGRYLIMIVLLGLAIFALMPRFPGYQIQTFPASSPIELDSQIDPQPGIVNPGYGPAEAETGGGAGDAQEAQAEIDPTFYYGFNSQINQNLRGEMEPKTMLRVRSQAPGFWRVLAFDRYTGQGWEISREDQLVDINRPSWTYRFTLSPPPTSGKTNKIVQTYTTVSEFPNLIPALATPRHLFFPAPTVALDPEGSLRAPAVLPEGLTYTVISEVPKRDRALLNQASQTYSDRIAEFYLQVPPALFSQLRQQAEALLEQSPSPLNTPYEQALFLAQALKQNYTLQPDLPMLEPGEDLATAFLRHEGGYPDHFSTVLTVMLRSLGIPARLAVGFAPGQFNPFTGYYIVRNTDAYALTEVYFPQYGWFAFDPIPGHELIPPSWEESQTFSTLRRIWHWVAGWLPSPVTSLLTVLGRQLGELVSFALWLWRFFSSSATGLFSGAIALVVLGLCGWLGRNWLHHWQERRQLAKLPPIARIYRQMLTKMQRSGYPKHPAQTPLEYAQTCRQHYPDAIAQIIDNISQAYMSWRYSDKIPEIVPLKRQIEQLSQWSNSQNKHPL